MFYMKFICSFLFYNQRRYETWRSDRRTDSYTAYVIQKWATTSSVWHWSNIS